jgi:hypothetical protein
MVKSLRLLKPLISSLRSSSPRFSMLTITGCCRDQSPSRTARFPPGSSRCHSWSFCLLECNVWGI